MGKYFFFSFFHFFGLVIRVKNFKAKNISGPFPGGGVLRLNRNLDIEAKKMGEGGIKAE